MSGPGLWGPKCLAACLTCPGPASLRPLGEAWAEALVGLAGPGEKGPPSSVPAPGSSRVPGTVLSLGMGPSNIEGRGPSLLEFRIKSGWPALVRGSIARRAVSREAGKNFRKRI